MFDLLDALDDGFEGVTMSTLSFKAIPKAVDRPMRPIKPQKLSGRKCGQSDRKRRAPVSIASAIC